MKHFEKTTENKEQSQKLTCTVRTACFPPFNFKTFLTMKELEIGKNKGANYVKTFNFVY